MCLRNTKKHLLYWLLCSILLVSLLFGQLNLGVYASTTDSGYIPTIQEQWAQNIYDNYIGIIQNAWKFTAPENTIENLWNDYIDWCYDIWNLNENDLQQNYHSFNRYVGSQWQVEKEPNTNQYTWHIDNSTQNYIDTWIQNYVGDNPLGYTVCTISSYKNINPDLFYNYNSYATFKEFMKQANGYAVLQCPNGWRNGYNGDYCMIYQVDTTKYSIGFYGTCVGSLFSSVQMEHNWSRTDLPLVEGVTRKVVQTTGNVTTTTYTPSFLNVYNTTGFSSGVNKGYIFTSAEKDEKVFCFSSLAALKRYNPQVPASYYLGEGYTGTCINPNGNGNYINNGGYQSIVGQLSNGMSADEIIGIINAVQNGSGGGSGNGGGNNNNPFGFLGEIGDLIRDLVTGVGDLLTDLVGSLVDVVLGTKQEDGTRSGGIIGLITDIISSLTGLINTNIGDFLSAVFSWLPTEFVTIFKAMLIFGIFFSIWKLIRG